MKLIYRYAFAAAALFAAILNSVTVATACGPFYVRAKFSLETHGDFPLTTFAKGNVGIVPASFRAMSLIVFYRQLLGAPLSDTEQKEVVRALETQIYYLRSSRATKDDSEPDYLAGWLNARAKIDAAKRDIPVDKQLADSYDWITNCLPDAFNTATKTLEARLAVHGNSDAVREWLKGQDAVFANCSEASSLPETLGADAPEWLRRDRAYQIAATKFYRGDFAGARSDFENVGADGGSPWSKVARFVAARTLIREANLSGGSATPAPDKIGGREMLFEDAATRLDKILKDPEMREFHASAHRLLGLVKYRMSPAERRPELASILSSAQDNPNIYNDVTDYIWLLDPVFQEAADVGMPLDSAEAEKAGKRYDYNYVVKLRDVPAEKRADELSDWLITYKAADGFEHALERWRSTGRLHWFVAAMSKVDGKMPAATELLNEAARIGAASPAFATVRYHQIRLMQSNGELAASRKILDEVLAKRDSLPTSTVNRFLAQRLAVATNLDDFLKFAPRKPVVLEWDESNREEDNGIGDDGYLTPWQTRSMFDADAVAFMNEKMPLSVLRQAALSKQLPDHLKRFLVIAVWTRAVTLGDRVVEREFTPLMQRFVPDFKTYFSKYAAATGETDRDAAALIVVLRYPVIQPFVPVGFGREDNSPVSIDSNRGNWWCSNEPADGGTERYGVYNFVYPEVSPDFLSAAQTSVAARERKKMADEGNSSTFLARRVVEFADRFPNHPKTPELLHLAVRSTRYGCSDDNTGKFSKMAFDRLHKRYPTSVWTEKTPYWFGYK